MQAARADRFTHHPAEARVTLGDERQADENTEPMIHPDLLLPSRPMSPRVPVFVTAAVACWTLATIGDLVHAELRLGLTLLAGVLAALVASVGSWRRSSSEQRMIAAAVSVSIACSIVGVVLFQGERADLGAAGMRRDPTMWPRMLVTGLGLGVVRALGMSPVAMVLYRVIATVGRARSGSLCDGADRRAVWSVIAAITVGFCGLFVAWSSGWATVRPMECFNAEDELLHWSSEHREFAIAGAAGLTVLLLTLGLDLVALLRCRRVSSRAEGMADWRIAGGVIEARGGQPLDLGVGEERWVNVTHEGDPYRGERRASVALVGDPQLAERMLRVAAVRSALLAGAGAAITIAARAAGTLR